jgi:hypothetical protein
MSEETKKEDQKALGYIASRYIEIVSIAIFIFGFLWNGTEVMNLTTPQFMMLYGGSGAVICEVLARLFSKKK